MTGGPPPGQDRAMVDPILTEIEQRLWQELVAAATVRGHAWRTATLATVRPDGAPDARTVVLREVDVAERRLIFYTDTRSPKVAQIAQRPEGVVVMWSPALGWQLRLRVALEVQRGGLAVLSRWAKVKMTPGVFDYLSPVPPGSPLERPAPERGDREHFGLVEARVTELDWLDLNTEGQRRARFGPERHQATWLAP